MSNWLRDHKILACIGALALISLISLGTANPQSATVSPKLNYTVVCKSNASPAVCSSDAAGFVALPSTGTTLTVDTTAVTPNSQIFIQFDAMLGSALGGITCDGAPTGAYWVSSRGSGTFQVTITPHPTANACFSYFIVN